MVTTTRHWIPGEIADRFCSPCETHMIAFTKDPMAGKNRFI